MEDGGGKTDALGTLGTPNLSFRLEVLSKVDCYAIDMISGMIAIVVRKVASHQRSHKM